MLLHSVGEDIDVVGDDVMPVAPSFDPVRARSMMNECEANVNFARFEDVPDDWEDRIAAARFEEYVIRFDQCFSRLISNILGGGSENVFITFCINVTICLNSFCFTLMSHCHNWNNNVRVFLSHIVGFFLVPSVYSVLTFLLF